MGMTAADPKVLARAVVVERQLQLTLGENVRGARLKRGLSQCDVADRTGLSQQSLSQLETGQGSVLLESLALLAVALAATPVDLISLQPDGKP